MVLESSIAYLKDGERIEEKDELKISLTDEMGEGVNAITHPSPFHADEVFASVMLSEIGELMLYRTRDLAEIDSAPEGTIIYDVGGKFNPMTNRYDHHQQDYNEKRPDGIKYSSCGLIWREFGIRIVDLLCGSNIATSIIKKLGISSVSGWDVGKKTMEETMKYIVSKVDENLIEQIDAGDNGQAKSDGTMTISSTVGDLNLTWQEDVSDDSKAFLKACVLAKEILEREITIETTKALGRVEVETKIEHSEGRPYIVLDEFINGWIDDILDSKVENADQILYGVFPGRDGHWNIQAVPPTKDDRMSQRKSFPEGWRGLRDRQLIDATGISGAHFCHASGFFAAADTKEAAIEMAKRAATAIEPLTGQVRPSIDLTSRINLKKASNVIKGTQAEGLAKTVWGLNNFDKKA